MSVEEFWNDSDRDKSKYSRKKKKIRAGATSLIANYTWTSLGLNPFFRGDRPATKRLMWGV